MNYPDIRKRLHSVLNEEHEDPKMRVVIKCNPSLAPKEMRLHMCANEWHYTCGEDTFKELKDNHKPLKTVEVRFDEFNPTPTREG